VNWLAHVFLSEPDVEFRLGNLLADIVRGEELRRMSPDFQRGVLRHMQIDAFTDAHPLVKRSRSRISPESRRFSGVLVDVF
jgi:acyl carrier protein phosphodiesterase